MSDHYNMDCSSAPSNPPAGLTKNEGLVWETLRAVAGPLKAYEILDHLKDRGVRAPMTVYRALGGLVHKGLIHKIEAMNAFVLCNHGSPHEVEVFTVCDTCERVKEIQIDRVEGLVAQLVLNTGFSMALARLEVRGVCESCAPSTPAT